jgi:VCBS repeat-containing protein
MRRLVLALMSVAALLVLPVGTAAADTVTEHNVTETMHDVLPCVGDATITVTYNEVDHFSQAANGSVHGTSTQTGTFSAVLDAGGTSTGRFTVWDGFNSSADGSQHTFTLTLSGTVKSGVGAGTNWNEVTHFTGPVDASGEPILDLAKVAFDNFRCH